MVSKLDRRLSDLRFAADIKTLDVRQLPAWAEARILVMAGAFALNQDRAETIALAFYLADTALRLAEGNWRPEL